jgi:hypothetical protein
MDKHSRFANGVPIKQRSFLETLKKLQNMMNIFINPGHWIEVPQDHSQLEVSELEVLYLRVLIQGTSSTAPEYNHKYIMQLREIILPALAKEYTNYS